MGAEDEAVLLVLATTAAAAAGEVPPATVAELVRLAGSSRYRPLSDSTFAPGPGLCAALRRAGAGGRGVPGLVKRHDLAPAAAAGLHAWVDAHAGAGLQPSARLGADHSLAEFYDRGCDLAVLLAHGADADGVFAVCVDRFGRYVHDLAPRLPAAVRAAAVPFDYRASFGAVAARVGPVAGPCLVALGEEAQDRVAAAGLTRLPYYDPKPANFVAADPAAPADAVKVDWGMMQVAAPAFHQLALVFFAGLADVGGPADLDHRRRHYGEAAATLGAPVPARLLDLVALYHLTRQAFRRGDGEHRRRPDAYALALDWAAAGAGLADPVRAALRARFEEEAHV
jgi:hypothetical protein